MLYVPLNSCSYSHLIRSSIFGLSAKACLTSASPYNLVIYDELWEILPSCESDPGLPPSDSQIGSREIAKIVIFVYVASASTFTTICVLLLNIPASGYAQNHHARTSSHLSTPSRKITVPVKGVGNEMHCPRRGKGRRQSSMPKRQPLPYEPKMHTRARGKWHSQQ